MALNCFHPLASTDSVERSRDEWIDTFFFPQKNDTEKEYVKLQEAHEGQQALLQKLQVKTLTQRLYTDFPNDRSFTHLTDVTQVKLFLVPVRFLPGLTIQIVTSLRFLHQLPDHMT